MKAVLEFNLPEETDEHRTALDGSKWKAVVESAANWLRNKAKYENKTTITVDEARTQLYQEMQDIGVSLD